VVRRASSLTIAAALVVVALAAPSGPSGDSVEYVALARQIAHQFTVTFSPAEAHAAGVSEPRFVAADGRQDLWHFWFFPALAAPFVWVTDALELDPHRGFALFNALLLSATAVLLADRIGLLWTIVFVAGPIVWWVPRAQVEVFTFSAVAAGCLSLPWRPALAAFLFSLASTQNPPVVVAVIVAAVRAVIRPPRKRGEFVWLGAAVLCAALHPVYYLWHLGRLTPLVAESEWRLPTLRAALSPVVDLNLGLLWCAPVAAVVILWSLTLKRDIVWRAILVFFAVAFLMSFAQAPNVNHGGTPSLSRYALWLIPLPLLVLDPAPRGRRVAALAVITAAWTVLFFRPTLPQSHLRPSALAQWVWQSHPGWDNPLPEIFAERLRHAEPAHTVAATGNCAKVLTTEGVWPIGCLGVPPPDQCVSPGAICYANETSGGGYEFVRVRRR
jgi:hypothetical protein